TDSLHEGMADVGVGSLHYRTCGNAGDLPDVLLEHGGGGSTQDWSLIEPLLAAHTRVFSYDRAGSGTSPRDDLGRGAVANTQRLSKLIEQLPIRKRFVLVGYSLGGLYARHYAALNPDQVAGVVLLDATPTKHVIKKSDFKRAFRTMHVLHWTARSGLATLYWYLSGKKIERERFQGYVKKFAAPTFVPNVREELYAISTVQADVAGVAERLTHPSLAILAGTTPKPSQAAILAEVRKLHDQLMLDAPAPLSRQTVVAGANHSTLVSDAQHAGTVAENILAFLRSLGSSEATPSVTGHQ
ncbi:MAG: alpha/beta fold hydrolase, partial [Stenotrophobium sp.]